MNSKRCRSWVARGLLVGGALAMAGGNAVAEVPDSITYRGELAADNGLPYTGSVDVTVRIYDAITAGQMLWDDTISGAAVMGGILEVDMDGVATALTGQGIRWVEFEIDGEILEPRQRLSAVPYAIQAWTAQRLGDKAAADYLTSDGPVFAQVAAAAPADPAAGQLWFDTASQALMVWADGAWTSATGLPTDGIGTISNGSLSNSFMGVQAAWSGPASDIRDAEPSNPPPPAMAAVTTSEGPGSYLTGLSISTNFGLNFNSELTVTLTPPVGSGVGPILLHSAAPFVGGTYPEVWTPANTPALTALLGQEVAGTWTLSLADLDNNAVGSPVIGQLTAFQVNYDVVRANHMVVDGRLDVTGALNVGGELYRKVQRFSFRRGHSTSSTTAVEVSGSNFNFVKHRADTALLIHWNDNLRAVSGSGSSRCEWVVRIDDALCTDPFTMKQGLYSSPADNNIHYPASFVQTCKAIAGAPISAGTHEVSIWVNSISGDCWTGHGATGTGEGLNAGLITVEEIY